MNKIFGKIGMRAHNIRTLTKTIPIFGEWLFKAYSGKPDEDIGTDGSYLKKLIETMKDGEVRLSKAIMSDEFTHRHIQTRVLMQIKFTVEQNYGAREIVHDD